MADYPAQTSSFNVFNSLSASSRLSGAAFAPRGMPEPGNGYLSGSFPGGITTVDAVPVSATVRVLYRPVPGSLGDGVLVAETQSAPDGTWRVDGLNPALRYDVVGRKAGLKDVIMSNVQPKVD